MGATTTAKAEVPLELVQQYQTAADPRTKNLIFAEIFKRLERLIDWYCSRFLYRVDKRARARLEFHDLKQHASFAVLEALNNFDPQKLPCFRAFVCLVIKHRLITAVGALNNRADKSGEMNFTSVADSPDAITDMEQSRAYTSATPISNLIHREAAKRLMGKLDDLLTPLERHCFTNAMRGESYEEIAAKWKNNPARRPLKVNIKCVDNSLQRATRKLKEYVGRKGKNL